MKANSLLNDLNRLLLGALCLLCISSFISLSAQQTDAGTSDRVIMGKSAVAPRKGQFSATGYIASIWDINYSPTDNITAGAYVNIPYYFVGAIPYIRYCKELNRNWSVGGAFGAGFITSYVDNPNNEGVFLSGGYAAVTGLFGRHMINFSTLVAGGSVYSNEENIDFNFINNLLFVPNAGYLFALNNRISLLSEIAFPAGSGELSDINGEIVIINYGVRISGTNLYGDIGFCLPMYEGFVNSAWKYIPLGVPYFTLGVRF